MRGLGLKVIYLASAAISLVLFLILYSKSRLPYVSINFFLLWMAAVGYMSPRRFLYGLVILPWLSLYPLLTFAYKVDFINAAFPILTFNGLILGFYASKTIIDNAGAECALKLNNQEKIKKEKILESEMLDSQENDIRMKELAVASLYEITKKMSGSLRFDDIFDIFGYFIKENFTFRRCELVILKESDSKVTVDRIYNTWSKRKPIRANLVNYERLLEAFSENSYKPLFLSRNDDERSFEILGIEKDKEEIRTFIGVPLLSGKKIVAIIIIENLPEADLEKFIILSAQLALEIKKVLLYESVEELAITDSLTSLYVRRYFLERFAEELARSKRHKFKVAFLMADLDDFKRCNDTYGHLVGDVVLKEIARIIKENTREIDLVGRYGGEEFSVVLPETDRDGASLVAERIRTKIEKTVFKAYDETLKMTISIGVSIYPDDSPEADELIDKADMALYDAKHSGKNIVSIRK